MKKILSIITITLLVFTIFGCAKNTGGNDSKNSTTNESSSNQEVSSLSGASSENPTVSSGNPSNTVSASQGGLTSSTTSSSQSTGSSAQTSTQTSMGNGGNQGEIVTEGTIKIVEKYGALETAVVSWTDASFDSYNVYYKKVGTNNFVKIDDQLIRRYPNYIRADAVGLAKGDYQLKVVGVNAGNEVASSESLVSVSVSAHTREGFAFSQQSPNKTASGAYNDDGTLQNGAQILYVTNENASKITLDVIKDSKGTKQTGIGLGAIMALRQKGYDKTPLSIRLIGQIDGANVSGLNDKNYLQVKGCYNITVEGIGSDATCYNWSFLIRDANNVEVRNLGIMLFKDDGISMDTDNYNIWIHNNDIFYGSAGSDSDQAKGDGSCDNKLTSYITVSYNHFWDSGKAILCGMADKENYFATFHHNWFDHSDSRHPRIRVGTIHVYNNYYDGVSKYGIGATTGSSCFSENNYFLNTKYPMLISMQGHDVGSSIFSSETGGMIKAFGNAFVGTTTAVTDQNQSATSFDCYVVANRNDKVPSTFKTLSGGTTYNNFDTDSTMYAYTPDSAENVPQMVKSCAGRINSDFTWTFTNADNTNYSVNSALMAKITSYKTALVKVGSAK